MTLTVAEKQARNREYQRAWRARRKSSSASSDSPAPRRSRARKTRSIEASVRAAVAAMKQLAVSDGALVDVAIAAACQLDKLIDADDLALAGRIFSGQQALTRMLHELGGTPIVRQQFEFRSRRVLPPPPAAAPDVEDADAGENVSAFRRPEKRARRRA